jgi:hypothetical protein
MVPTFSHCDRAATASSKLASRLLPKFCAETGRLVVALATANAPTATSSFLNPTKLRLLIGGASPDDFLSPVYLRQNHFYLESLTWSSILEEESALNTTLALPFPFKRHSSL